MDAVHVIAVAGAHAGERSRYAERLARVTGRTYFAADDLAGSPDPAQEAAVRSSWADPGVGAVIELPHEVPAPDLIGAFADQDDRVRLVGLVCVVDVMRLLDDLHQADHLPLRDAESGIAAQLTARALLTVMQLEYASTIVLMRWEPLSPADLATTMALVSHLSPTDDGGRSAEGELLAIGQDLALIGMDLDHGAVAVALDDAALTDAELSAGPAAWEGFADPFPIWRRAADPAD